jgi:hypothetical protein
MARTFSKNVANYMTLPAGSLGSLFSGKAKLSISAWVFMNSFTTGANDNGLITVIDTAATVGVEFSISGAASAAKVRASGRSQSTDARQSFSGATTVSISTWHHVGMVMDLTNKVFRVYLDGSLDGTSGALTFGATTWVQGTTPTTNDTIGGIYLPTPATTDQFDGNIAELALWSDDIADSGMAALGKGYSPELIRPSLLLEHFPLLGTKSPEPSTRSTLAGTINGSVPAATHPRILQP